MWNDQHGLHVANFGSVDGISVWVGNVEEEQLIKRQVGNSGWAPKIARFTGDAGQLEFVVVTDAVDIDGNGTIEGLDESAGVFTSNFASGAPFAWTRLGVTPFPDHLCGINSSVDPESGEPVFYLQAGGHCNNWSAGGSRLYRYVGLNPSQHWRRLDDLLIGTPLPGGVGVVAVDRNNANRLYVSNLCGNQCPVAGTGGRMMSSLDGGHTWTHATALDDMMTGKGLGPGGSSAFLFANSAGLIDTFRAVFGGYPQPSLVAFDPIDPNIIVAGGRDSGLFITTDGGAHWMLLTNPIAPTASRPHIPRPHFVHFAHDPDGVLWLYVGTHGRGVWRIRLALPTANAGGPYHTQEGQNITLSASGSSPDGTPVSFAWDFDNDGVFDDASGPTPVFDRVGRDGLSFVRVRVSVGHLSTVDQALVFVSNVPPTVAALTANAPKAEHSPVTIAGRIVDPGWQDALRVTINWGDGTPIEQVDGTQESVRPDASFVFSTYHTYGDNGLFLAIVCRYDDDTHGCEAFTVQITNIAPTAVIEQPQSVMIRGARTVITRSGVPVAVTGRATDPGSDDLTLTWTWHDGTPDIAHVSLVNPPGADVYPSPSVQPRDVTDDRSHTYAPCLYDLVFRATDDDGTAASDSVKMLVTGTSTERAAAGYWRQQYTGGGPRSRPRR